MKKTITIVILALALSSICMAAENSIYTKLGVPFGEICIIKAEFVDKGDSYYAKNVSKAEYYLNIYEINGNKLSQPSLAEPICENIKPEKHKMYMLKAYEIIRSEGAPRGWTENMEQMGYGINNYIIIKNP